MTFRSGLNVQCMLSIEYWKFFSSITLPLASCSLWLVACGLQPFDFGMISNPTKILIQKYFEATGPDVLFDGVIIRMWSDNEIGRGFKIVNAKDQSFIG